MAGKNEKGGAASLSRLKKELANGIVNRFYLFYGEEAYLREHYIGQIKRMIVDEDESNFCTLVGKACTPKALAEELESFPLFAERKLILVRDYDILTADAKMAAEIEPLLADLSPSVCLIVAYGDTAPGAVGRKNKKIEALVNEHAQRVEFAHQSRADLVRWVIRRFESCGKSCGEREAGYLLDQCGDLMSATLPELLKVASYTKGPQIRVEDIDAIAMPIGEAIVYQITDALAQKNIGTAVTRLDRYLKQGNDETAAVQAIGRAMRQLYAAALAETKHLSTSEFMQMARIPNAYAASKVQAQARRFRPESLRRAAILCFAAEKAMFGNNANRQTVLETLIYELCI
ncbi:MAG: DNA polymerase III subunit delta [Clostridia bacterium]|nr:DNA polymerase III subunit delta [Clostridia bacterium]